MLKLESLNACRLKFNGSLICFAHLRNFIIEQQAIVVRPWHTQCTWMMRFWELGFGVHCIISIIISQVQVHQNFGLMKLFQDLFKL